VRQNQFLDVLDPEEARRRFHEALGSLEPKTELVPLGEALDRRVARDVRSYVDVPGFDRSNVDGYAVRAEDTFGAEEHEQKSLELTQSSVAVGCMPSEALAPGQAMPVPTGGAIPRGADAVVMVEHTREVDGRVHIRRAVTPGRFVTFAGTDIAHGEVVMRSGRRLTSRETGVLAAIGQGDVLVTRQPRVAILSTGDELVAAGRPARAGQVYDCNAVMLADAVRECGGLPWMGGIVPDEEPRLRAALTEALAKSDVVLLSGGTSKGPGDINAQVVEAVAAPPGIVAHGIALKPGKPLCLAVSGRTPVVVLPGFPTSAIFTFHEFVAPVIRAMAGGFADDVTTTTAEVPFRITSAIGRAEYVLVRLIEADSGRLVAFPMGKGSGSVTTWSHADGYFVIPRLTEMLEAGEEVQVRALGGTKVQSADLVVIGSHCTGVDLLLDHVGRRGLTSKFIAVGSEGGLAAIRRGEGDVAGVHLFDPDSGEYNRPFLPEGFELVRGYGRMQGLVFRAGDARFEGKRAEDAVREVAFLDNVVMVNRNRGSGTRALIELLLEGARPTGYAVEASSHHAVAAAVAQGRADFGVAIDIVARQRELGFSPIREERFDFVVAKARQNRPGVRALVDALGDANVRAELGALGLRI